MEQNGQSVGSELIGQPFSAPEYFWGGFLPLRHYPMTNASASSGSNYGPSNPALLQEIQKRIDALKAVDPKNTQPIPIDLVTASASGLDPDISVAAALYQIPRVARYWGMSEEKVRTLVDRYIKSRQFGVLGEPRVNVLKLNMALDKAE